jgi:type VI secretion system protein ImpC
VPTADAREVLERVSAFIAEHHGEGRDFRAVLADPMAAAAVELDSSPFARVAAEVLLRLGGDHARLVARGPVTGRHATPGSHGIPIPGGSGPGTPSAPPEPGETSPRPAAGAQSLPHRRDRVRQPRVHIAYEVMAADARVLRELPFVIGVLADLSGDPAEALHKPLRHSPRVPINYDVEVADTSVRKELPFVVAAMSDHPREPLAGFKNRKFIHIDRENFDVVLEHMAPRLVLMVPNRLEDDSPELAIELGFRSIDDFGPEVIVRRVSPLRSLLEMRNRLANLVAQVEANDELEATLSSILVDRELTSALAEQLRRAELTSVLAEQLRRAELTSALAELLQRESPPEGRESPRSAPPAAEPNPSHESDPSLLVQVLAAARPRGEAEEEATWQILRDLISAGPNVRADRDLVTELHEQVGRIDRNLSRQVAAILYDPDFQRLEATWRGLYYLVHQTETSELLKIKVFNVSKMELLRDQEEAVEFDQSILFRQVYENELGTPGGEPYGLLVGDYQFSHHPQDLMLLRWISTVAAASHAPFIAAASPGLFGLRSFTELGAQQDIAQIFRGQEYDHWRAFRESEDSRYVGLTLPRILMRLPYGPDSVPIANFNFQEVEDSSYQSHFLWASAAWAFAARVADAVARDGWPAAIRGGEGGGLVRNLPIYTFRTAGGEIAAKCPTEAVISDRRELELSQLGFLPLCHLGRTDSAAFVSTSSCQKPRVYVSEAAIAAASLTSQIHLTLCVSRFAHYLMAISLDRVGSFMSREDCELLLNRWITNYVTMDETASEETKRNYPLRDARVDVEDDPSRPGTYRAVAYLRPHLGLEELMVALRLVVALPRRTK